MSRDSTSQDRPLPLADALPDYARELVVRLRETGRADLAATVATTRIHRVSVSDDRCILQTSDSDVVRGETLSLAAETLTIGDGRIRSIEIHAELPARAVLRGLASAIARG